MSGYPLNFPTDAAKLRQNYLANLSLQANINDMNLQANKIYKKTGQTPTQPTDNRTTAEKLGDIERLKIDVRGELSKIADGTQAAEIAQQLNPDELQFLAHKLTLRGLPRVQRHSQFQVLTPGADAPNDVFL